MNIKLKAYVLKTHNLNLFHIQNRLQLPPVFYQPNYGDGGDIPEERIVTIANSSETEYADIEETIKVHN